MGDNSPVRISVTIVDGSLEAALMAALEQVVENLSSNFMGMQLSPAAIERATTWLASKHRVEDRSDA